MVNASMQVKTDVGEILNAFCTPDSYTQQKGQLPETVEHSCVL